MTPKMSVRSLKTSLSLNCEGSAQDNSVTTSSLFYDCYSPQFIFTYFFMQKSACEIIEVQQAVCSSRGCCDTDDVESVGADSS